MSRTDILVKQLDENKINHSHENGQILIPLSGLLFLKTHTSELIVDQNSIAIVPPNIMHYSNGNNQNETLIINFPKHYLKQTDFDIVEDIFVQYLSEKMKQVKELLTLELQERSSASSLDYLFFYLYDLLLSRPECKSIEYIFKHYDENISIQYLASLEHYSENYFREWFKKKTSLSPKNYVTQFRIEKAKELLITTKYSVVEIAYQVGFSHNSSFSRAFKEIANETPLAYRNRHKT